MNLEMTEAQKTLYYIAENMKLEKKISDEGYQHFQMAIKALEQQPSEDCVSREQAIVQLSIDLSEIELPRIKDSLDKLAPVTPAQSWIPVSERLPENEGLYLVSVENDHLRHYSKTCWFNSHRNWFSRQDVIAWQPLPKPYEEKRGNEND